MTPVAYERLYTKAAYKRVYKHDPGVDDKLTAQKVPRSNGDIIECFGVWFGDDDIFDRRTFEVSLCHCKR